MKSHAFEEYLMTQVKNNNVVFINNDMYQLIIYKYIYIIYMHIVYVIYKKTSEKHTKIFRLYYLKGGVICIFFVFATRDFAISLK